jgi:hypothetical protein
MNKREAAALVTALACSTLFVAGKFSNQFVYDDLFMIRGPLIHEPARMPEVFAAHAMIAHGDLPPMALDTYRPLSLITFFWDAWLSGHETWSYHLTNHLLHLAVVACVFALARRLLPGTSVWFAAAVALFFGLSPQLAEAHVWINGRSDPLATLFGLLALLVWHDAGAGGRFGTARRIAAAALFFAGLLCKEVLLFALPSLLLWPAPQALSTRIRSLVPFAISGALYLALRTWALEGLHAAGGTSHLLQALRNLPVLWLDGLTQVIAPSRLYLRSMRDEYGVLTSTQHLLIALTLVACLGLMLFARRRLPVLCWGLAWFACTLAPAAMITVLLWPGFGRYLYMPCVGLALGGGELLALASAAVERRFAEAPERVRWARGIGRFVVGTYLLSLGAGLAVVTDDYADNESLYMAAARAAPKPAYAFAWFGTARANAGNVTGSIGPLEKAVQLDPGEPRYLHDLARSYMLAGHSAQAERLLRSGITRAPPDRSDDLRVLLMRGLAGANPKAAMAELCQCLHYQPDSPPCLAAPRWLLDPRGLRAAEFREEFAQFDTTCASARARGAIARVLAR